jgi:hypothetical protein
MEVAAAQVRIIDWRLNAGWKNESSSRLQSLRQTVMLCAFTGHGHAGYELYKAVAVSLGRNR